jgi:hypothetical protein
MGRIDIVGQKFERLLVLEYNSNKKSYLCQCDCGNLTHARSWYLRNGKHKSCGCLQKELLAKRCYKDNYIGLKNEIYKNYLKAAKRRNYSFELSKEIFYKLINGDCHYCGIKPNTKWFGTKRTIIDVSEFRYNGVDRVDNNIGYTLENSVSCCKICNNAKNTLTTEEFLNWVNLVYQFQMGKIKPTPDKYFPRFWFEGNHAFMWVNSLDDLQEVFDNYEGIMTPDKILDTAVNNPNVDKDFGLRGEHTGDITLRKFLEQYDYKWS